MIVIENIVKFYPGYYDNKVVIIRQGAVDDIEIKNNEFEYMGNKYGITDDKIIYIKTRAGKKVLQLIYNTKKNKLSRMRFDNTTGAITYEFFKISITVYPNSNKLHYSIDNNQGSIDIDDIPDDATIDAVYDDSPTIKTFNDDFTYDTRDNWLANTQYNPEKKLFKITIQAPRPVNLSLSTKYVFTKRLEFNFRQLKDIIPEWQITTINGKKKVPFILSVINVDLLKNMLSSITYKMNKSIPYPHAIPGKTIRNKYGVFQYNSPKSYVFKSDKYTIVSVNNRKYVAFKPELVADAKFSGRDLKTGEELYILPVFRNNQQAVLARKLGNKYRIYGIVTGEGIVTIEVPQEKLYSSEPISIFDDDVKLLATHIIFPYQLRGKVTRITLDMSKIRIDDRKLVLPTEEFFQSADPISTAALKHRFKKYFGITPKAYASYIEFGTV